MACLVVSSAAWAAVLGWLAAILSGLGALCAGNQAINARKALIEARYHAEHAKGAAHVAGEQAALAEQAQAAQGTANCLLPEQKRARRRPTDGRFGFSPGDGSSPAGT